MRDYIHGKLTPGVTGEEGTLARNRMEDALIAFRHLGTNDPANKPMLGNMAAVKEKADQLIGLARRRA